jgi:hypothetical protein
MVVSLVWLSVTGRLENLINIVTFAKKLATTLRLLILTTLYTAILIRYATKLLKILRYGKDNFANNCDSCCLCCVRMVVSVIPVRGCVPADYIR